MTSIKPAERNDSNIFFLIKCIFSPHILASEFRIEKYNFIQRLQRTEQKSVLWFLSHISHGYNSEES